MYTGSNPKALLTVTFLADAFEKELREKSYAEITVKGLCARAQVSRQAFYNVYDSKEEVLRFCIRRILRETVDRRREGNAHAGIANSPESIRVFIDMSYRNGPFLSQVVANHREKEVIEEFVAFVTDELYQEGWRGDPYTGYRLAFYAGGIVQILIHWLQDEHRITEEELIDILDGLNLPSFM